MKWKQWPIKTIQPGDREWPEGLKKVGSGLKKLYYRGEWNRELWKDSVAIVGSRKMSRYGEEAVKKLMPEIVARKITVISGFMYGIDTQAHRQCLELKGRTAAVLGGGLDYVYPADNDALYDEILANNGVVLSEYEKDFVPTLWSFPQRNRLVAALVVRGIIVVEAGLKSGSLITARLGKKYGKKVWAVPGLITSNGSLGTNYLIKQKQAEMITGAEDIVGGEKTEVVQDSLFESFSKEEQQIIDILKREYSTIDEIARELGQPVATVIPTLSRLSMRNKVEEEMGRIYLTGS